MPPIDVPAVWQRDITWTKDGIYTLGGYPERKIGGTRDSGRGDRS